MHEKFSKIKKACLLVRQGFSLIEVLLSLLVVSFGVTAAAALMVNNIKNLQTSKNQIIASQLAQEGTELVRNLKDNKQLDGSPYSFVSSGNNKTDLRIDKTMSFFDDSTHPEQLYLNGNFYTHTAGTPTKFYRRIDLTVAGDITPPSTREITIISYVTWNNVGFTAMEAAVGGLSKNSNIANQCISVESIMPDQGY